VLIQEDTRINNTRFPCM